MRDRPECDEFVRNNPRSGPITQSLIGNRSCSGSSGWTQPDGKAQGIGLVSYIAVDYPYRIHAVVVYDQL